MADGGERSRANPGFLIGWLFFALAFVSAAAETGLGKLGITPAYDLWYTLDPGSLVISKIRIDEWFGEGAWNGLKGTALALPAWALFGIPAAFLLWFFRPHRNSDIAEAEAAIGYYDMLAKAAQEQGAEDDLPRWQDLEDLPGDEHPEPVKLNKDPIDHYMEQWVPPQPDKDEPTDLEKTQKDLEEIGDHGQVDPGLKDWKEEKDTP